MRSGAVDGIGKRRMPRNDCAATLRKRGRHTGTAAKQNGQRNHGHQNGRRRRRKKSGVGYNGKAAAAIMSPGGSNKMAYQRQISANGIEKNYQKHCARINGVRTRSLQRRHGQQH